ncbi:hypothetical protein EVAR_6664_1 [Eumeta japonica]|uniref:Uncharacterized protein n=1 Tax=Eumeta variegata TaxID=151549 RepID=A0A4C1TNC5_EUMVA|nr:hypothetical protein EVAR_6664_1 [Eumeta japonica]
MHTNSEVENKFTQTNVSPLSKRAYSNKIAQRTRKMAKRIGNAYRKFKESNCTNPAMSIANSDLKQFEQMVIMKKYPYLDPKDFESKYGPGSAGERGKVNVKLAALGADPSICEAPDDGPNVEIMNRGLSGFAIPPPEINALKQKAEIPKEDRRCDVMRTALSDPKGDMRTHEGDEDYRT